MARKLCCCGPSKAESEQNLQKQASTQPAATKEVFNPLATVVSIVVLMVAIKTILSREITVDNNPIALFFFRSFTRLTRTVSAVVSQYVNEASTQIQAIPEDALVYSREHPAVLGAFGILVALGLSRISLLRRSLRFHLSRVVDTLRLLKCLVSSLFVCKTPFPMIYLLMLSALSIDHMYQLHTEGDVKPYTPSKIVLAVEKTTSLFHQLWPLISGAMADSLLILESRLWVVALFFPPYNPGSNTSHRAKALFLVCPAFHRASRWRLPPIVQILCIEVASSARPHLPSCSPTSSRPVAPWGCWELSIPVYLDVNARTDG